MVPVFDFAAACPWDTARARRVFAGEHDGFCFLRRFWLLLLLWFGGFWWLPDGKAYTHFLAAGFRRQQVQKFRNIAQHGLETAVAEVTAGNVVVCQKLGDVVDGMNAVIDLFTEKAVELLFLSLVIIEVPFIS